MAGGFNVSVTKNARRQEQAYDRAMRRMSARMRAEAAREAQIDPKLLAVAKAARRFLASVDEFLPEYPEAVQEPLDRLITAVDALGDDDTPAEPVNIPLYEP